MTTQTIEYDEVVTRKERIAVCDECNENEIDVDGAKLPTKHGDLHFCSGCIERLAGHEVDFKAEYVRRVDEWKDTTDLIGKSVRSNLGTYTRHMVLLAAVPIVVLALYYVGFEPGLLPILIATAVWLWALFISFLSGASLFMPEHLPTNRLK